MYSFLHSFSKCPLRTRPCAGYSETETNQTGSRLTCEFKLRVEADACPKESEPHPPLLLSRSFLDGAEPRESFVGVWSVCVGGCFLIRPFSKHLARVLKADKGVKKPDSQKEEHLKSMYPNRLSGVCLGSGVSDATRSADRAPSQRSMAVWEATENKGRAQLQSCCNWLLFLWFDLFCFV